MRTDRMQRFECNFLISIGLTLLLVAATIVLSSTAKAAERVGGSLGEFVEAGEHGGRPYYRQRDTEGGSLTEESTYLRTLFVRGYQNFCVLGPFHVRLKLNFQDASKNCGYTSPGNPRTP